MVLLNMKNLIALFILLFSPVLLAETYSCSYDFYGESRPLTFERSKENFIVNGVGENTIPIFFEDYEILVLAKVIVDEDLSGLHSSVINKLKKNFRMTILYEFDFEEQTSAIIEGQCITFGN